MADTVTVEYTPVTGTRDLVDRLFVTYMAMATAPDTLGISSLELPGTPLDYVKKAAKKAIMYVLAVDYGITNVGHARIHTQAIWSGAIADGVTLTAAIAHWYEQITR